MIERLEELNYSKIYDFYWRLQEQDGQKAKDPEPAFDGQEDLEKGMDRG